MFSQFASLVHCYGMTFLPLVFISAPSLVMGLGLPALVTPPMVGMASGSWFRAHA